MRPLKLLERLPPVFRKVKLAKAFLRIGGNVSIPDTGVPSDALEKKACFGIKALE